MYSAVFLLCNFSKLYTYCIVLSESRPISKVVCMYQLISIDQLQTKDDEIVLLEKAKRLTLTIIHSSARYIFTI